MIQSHDNKAPCSRVMFLLVDLKENCEMKSPLYSNKNAIGINESHHFPIQKSSQLTLADTMVKRRKLISIDSLKKC